MKLHMPDGIDLSVRPVGPDLYSYDYTEHFSIHPEIDSLSTEEKIEELLENTALLVKRAYPKDFVISCGPNWINIYHPGLPRKSIGNMMATEFIGWSALGSTTFGDLFGEINYYRGLANEKSDFLAKALDLIEKVLDKESKVPDTERVVAALDKKYKT